jgi:hypothetical protein
MNDTSLYAVKHTIPNGMWCVMVFFFSTERKSLTGFILHDESIYIFLF